MSSLLRVWILAILVMVSFTCMEAQNSVHAFLWSASTGMQDLGSLGGNSYAQAINNSGQVVGMYVNGLGNYRAFLWTSGGGMQGFGHAGRYVERRYRDQLQRGGGGLGDNGFQRLSRISVDRRARDARSGNCWRQFQWRSQH